MWHVYSVDRSGAFVLVEAFASEAEAAACARRMGGAFVAPASDAAVRAWTGGDAPHVIPSAH